MAKMIINGEVCSGSNSYASAVEYIKEDGSKTTVQNELDGLNSNIDELNKNLTDLITPTLLYSTELAGDGSVHTITLDKDFTSFKNLKITAFDHYNMTNVVYFTTNIDASLLNEGKIVTMVCGGHVEGQGPHNSGLCTGEIAVQKISNNSINISAKQNVPYWTRIITKIEGMRY